ncbi:MAG: toxin-antitoxin system YwqK family antitoxin [Bacteroidota bacterium]
MNFGKSFLIATVAALILSACGGGGSSATPVAANLVGYAVIPLAGTSASIAEKYDADGNKVESGFVVNGMKNGQWTQYDADGKIRFVVNYIDGLKNGDELSFNTRGQIEARTSYKNDQLHGISGTYKSGRPTQEVSYKDGQFDGPTRKYFRDGKLQQEIYFKNGKQHGSFKYFDEEGNVTLEYEYKNGEKVSGGIVEK